MYEEFVRRANNHPLLCRIGEKNHDEKLWAILPVLIKSETITNLVCNSVKLTGCQFSTMSNFRFQELIRCLGANTPNLKELKMISPCSLEYSLEERELASINKLKNLTILDIIRVRVPLSGIMEISHQCKKLKIISAEFSVKIDEVSSIPALRDDFVFVDIGSFLGVDLIPYLRMETDPDNDSNRNLFRLMLEPRHFREFSLAIPFAKKLRSIYIDCAYLVETEEIVEFPHLPVIDYALIDCKGKSTHALRCFLKRNGESLRELRLEGIHSKKQMTFREIFSFCPNLQCLELFHCNLSRKDPPLDAIKNLERFYWH
ncbi:Hypothetical predicted protein [Cloeon dipterum]|uniref:Uncharacterized protein n=1 Tax=Cloeon dipterum TaxID=197152 RepID=A0A8S1E2F8_9INSE|nr:Hypothetical predicted protein [Cloeon dipterum]